MKKNFGAFVIVALLPACAMAQTPPPVAPAPAPMPPALPYGNNIGFNAAKEILARAEAEAQRQNLNMAIAIVETNGTLVAFSKMDNVAYASIDIAMEKARTAARFKRATSVFQDGFKAGNLNAIPLGAMPLEGGEPIVRDGKIIGAIGVSGATSAQDGVVARAGAGN